MAQINWFTFNDLIHHFFQVCTHFFGFCAAAAAQKHLENMHTENTRVNIRSYRSLWLPGLRRQEGGASRTVEGTQTSHKTETERERGRRMIGWMSSVNHSRVSLAAKRKLWWAERKGFSLSYNSNSLIVWNTTFGWHLSALKPVFIIIILSKR